MYAFAPLLLAATWWREAVNGPHSRQDKELASLEPVKSYPHLLFVNVARNQIADPSPLAELPYLVSVDLSENALAAPPALPNEHLQVEACLL
jgi:Leucine-rich repeat (LRR) protein